MKVHLLHENTDPDLDGAVPPQADALVRDLGLDTLFDATAGGDEFLRAVAHATLLTPLREVGAIRYRQDVLRDCSRNPEAVRALYDVAVEAIDARRKGRGWFFGDYPHAVLQRSVELLERLLVQLKELRRISDEQAALFESTGFRELFAMIARDLPDDYFGVVEDHLQRLRFRNGVFMTAEIGEGAKGTGYVLRKPHTAKRTWRDVVPLADRLHQGGPATYVYRLPERDEAGARAFSDLKDRGINLVADALAQSTDHILAFFTMLRWELGFYLGCLNLHAELSRKDLPLCFPTPMVADELRLTTRDLYDTTLGVRLDSGVVGNDLSADGASLVMITGTNQGGKSTFLRSIGAAQLMMQAGMFCAASSYTASISPAVFTHFEREEDAGMEKGKLDEELVRLSEIVDQLEPRSLVLFNESFASTNEREGAQIARQIIDALREAGIRVAFVTHMYQLAKPLEDHGGEDAIFLRPERLEDGRRTFKLVQGGPLRTSHGLDVYDRVIGAAPAGVSGGGD
jgi:hypothetical protein